ncbi:g12371 [Coccomyxa viridis]|uniref:uracil phosphoribosyltransferase n=1 Tax=Coccomyxa viridis TaxID=1274662 RepID=A0ABP1GH72_9CHLO
MLVYVPSHPLVKHWLAVARNKLSPPAVFRGALAELGRLLIYEASAEEGWLPVLEGQAETPCGIADVTFLDPGRPVKVVPILRAGLVLLEQAATVLPNSQTMHVGYVRNEETLEATSYLNKLPDRLAADDRILVVDPMLATGGTLIKVLEDIIGRGGSPSMIRVVTVVCAPAALQKLSSGFPGLKVYAAMIDAELNERGYIVPGLGDAGDRAFNTL